MRRSTAIKLMPAWPATWGISDYMRATGHTKDRAKNAINCEVKRGMVEVMRRGSIHGPAIYRRTPEPSTKVERKGGNPFDWRNEPSSIRNAI